MAGLYLNSTAIACHLYLVVYVDSNKGSGETSYANIDNRQKPWMFTLIKYIEIYLHTADFRGLFNVRSQLDRCRGLGNFLWHYHEALEVLKIFFLFPTYESATCFYDESLALVSRVYVAINFEKLQENRLTLRVAGAIGYWSSKLHFLTYIIWRFIC